MPAKGKIFETEFKNSARNQGIYTLRINDVYLSYKNNNAEQWCPQNPFDFIVYSYPNMLGIECKSTTYKRIGIQRTPEDPKAMIPAHQIQALNDLATQPGCYAGFLFNWRNDKDKEDNHTYYMSIDKFNTFLKAQDMKSISLGQCIEYGGIEVEGVLKRIHYVYDVGKLITDIRKEGSHGTGL